MLFKLDRVTDLHVYQYQFIDSPPAIMNPHELNKQNHTKLANNELTEIINIVAQQFKKNGWEGDGDIGLIWLPPFVETGELEDTFGSYLWYVKQNNNGISFIGSRFRLKFPRLLDQNQNTEYTVPENIIEDQVKRFTEKLSIQCDAFENEVKQILTSMSSSEGILIKIYGYTQCQVIAQLAEFIDDCYLEILLEVLQRGNKSKIKLRKSAIKIDLSKHKNHEEGFDDEASEWMTLQMLISDIWSSFQFEPFDEKLEKLLTAVDYKMDPELKSFIRKHIFIRNCIQHHDWKLDGSVKKMLGQKSIKIWNGGTPIEIYEWKTITLTTGEIGLLYENIKRFIADFNAHIDKRVVTKYYTRPE